MQSLSTTSAIATRFSGSPAAGTSLVVRARGRTREPLAALLAAVRAMRRSAGRIISGAPTTHDPKAPKAAALHFLEDENGTLDVAHHPAGSVKRPTIACIVAFGLVSAAPRAPRASVTSTASASDTRRRISSTERRPPGGGPGLSKQTTSTPARPP